MIQVIMKWNMKTWKKQKKKLAKLLIKSNNKIALITKLVIVIKIQYKIKKAIYVQLINNKIFKMMILIYLKRIKKSNKKKKKNNKKIEVTHVIVQCLKICSE